MPGFDGLLNADARSHDVLIKLCHWGWRLDPAETDDVLMLAGWPRPVTPAYLLLSATLQPEFSAVLVGLKPPARAIADSRRRLEYFLAAGR